MGDTKFRHGFREPAVSAAQAWKDRALAAERELAATRERLAALQWRIQERALSLEGRTIAQEEIPYEDGGPNFETAAHLRFAARELRAALDDDADEVTR